MFQHRIERERERERERKAKKQQTETGHRDAFCTYLLIENNGSCYKQNFDERQRPLIFNLNVDKF